MLDCLLLVSRPFAIRCKHEFEPSMCACSPCNLFFQVVVPALTIATDMTHYQALGTSLLAMAPTAVVGTFSHYRRGNVALRVAFPLSLGAFVGAYAGGKFGMTIPEDKLRWGFSSLMLTLGIRALTRKA